ncbi:MAG: Unknown protein [uncultured Thiotrichaceae bacterium]|uniref:Uncharacterized protein n=1 Tax=uncultured Thiotrichaceae bacterium TaxID=298394 RepID=A0A6S6TUD1_9GAMM|nr:MAG: Unknown protein [uncultured Thiotrichaceae bacterium]
MPIPWLIGAAVVATAATVAAAVSSDDDNEDDEYEREREARRRASQAKEAKRKVVREEQLEKYSGGLSNGLILKYRIEDKPAILNIKNIINGKATLDNMDTALPSVVGTIKDLYTSVKDLTNELDNYQKGKIMLEEMNEHFK